MTPKLSPNFAYLAYHDARLSALATQAEQHFAGDPTITLFKLRQFGEVLAQRAAAKVGLFSGPAEPQQQLIDRLFERGVIGATQRALFHDLRRVGNAAVHEGKGSHSDALHQLRMARELAVWFQRSFGSNQKFDPGPFLPPPEPQQAEAVLHDELSRLRSEVDAHRQELAAARLAIEAAQRAADAELRAKLSAQELAAKATQDAAIWEALASEQIEAHRQSSSATAQQSAALQQQNKQLQAELLALSAAAQALPVQQLEQTIALAAAASDAIELDEAATRKLIDQQLRSAGWEVDTDRLTFAKGARPVPGKNLAIAEWPTLADGQEGRADYVLFAGLVVVAIVEAKRKHKDVSGVIPQAKRYSVGYIIHGSERLAERSPWGKYKVPFLFATNGRPFLRQLQTKSGIWFLDVRRSVNHPVPLEGFYTPEGLLDRLRQDIDDAHDRLALEPMPYIDRDYQRNAIRAAEQAIAREQRELLIAMATGTGKTRICIGLCYRLIKTKRFRRILFLVDRNALGQQTADAFHDLRLESLQTFSDIFEVKELADLTPDRTTKLHIATIQAMCRRVLGPHDDRSAADIPPVDQYDCIIVDECHRGYLLDRELSDREFQFRDEADFISKYRRVLDHFDAVKIGLTATPALHTKEIFGPPVFSYTYREAVMDGFLVDHEPPIRIITQLARDGIHYQAQQQVLVLDRSTQTLHKEELADEVSFDVDTFNRRVITEPWNRVVLTELAEHIDPAQDEKTLIFCASDEHADLVVRLLKEALARRYGSVDDDAVAKITGQVDRPLQAIRRYRNERQPNIAVTVDLLTTGVDVPKIANLVFLRRVKSRILYEQMLGRATRLCPEIGKERFRIFDAVDLYTEIQKMTDMKPVVIHPQVSFAQLVSELCTAPDEPSRRAALDELRAKLQRKKRLLQGEAAERLHTAAAKTPTELIQFVRTASLDQVADYFAQHPAVAATLDRTTSGGSSRAIVSDTPDALHEVARGYGLRGQRPGDYLDAFRAFIRSQTNQLPALLVVTQRPKDLTREDLRALKLALDEAGFSESALRIAWREQKNEDIAASIIGYIRQLALGSPLCPYAERVDRAVQRLRKAHKFTDPQSKWLDRIAKQVKLETVVDKAALDTGQFKAEGGFARLNRVFDGKLEAVLNELAEQVWNDAA